MLEDEVGRPCSPGGQLHVVDLGPILSCHDTQDSVRANRNGLGRYKAKLVKYAKSRQQNTAVSHVMGTVGDIR